MFVQEVEGDALDLGGVEEVDAGVEVDGDDGEFFADEEGLGLGEEGLDARWKDTPIINIQSIQVISTNAVPRVIFKSPRQSQRH